MRVSPVIIAILMIMMMMWFGECCLESEKLGLLEIKNKFPESEWWRDLISDWGSDSDCCSWFGVVCNSSTGHVTQLKLYGPSDSSYSSEWYLNASVFLSFPHLYELHLSGNGIAGCIENEGFERLSTLSNLEILDLSFNQFNNSILQSLSSLLSLKSLDLFENRLNKISGFESLSTLTNLEILGLGGNSLNSSSSFLQSLGAFHSLKFLDLISTGLHGTFNISDLNGFPNLQELYLSFNKITEFVNSKDLRGPSNLSTLDLAFMRETYDDISTLNLQSLVKLLPNIKTLSLRYNNFQGQIFREALCQLEHLQELDMQENGLTGNLPWCLANFTSLRKLDLSRNQFSGKMSLSPLQSLTSLQYLDLSRNQFSGKILSPLQSLTSLQYLDLSNNFFQIPVSLTPLFNHSHLTFLHIDNNTIYAETEDHNLNPKFQLEDISLSGYGDIREIPKFLYHQHNLSSVVISNFKIRGMFPNWLFENNTRLKTLDLSNNSLYGPLLLPNKPLVNLTFLLISDNYFNSSISSQFGLYFPSLIQLNMSKNEFMGSIPSSMCSSTSLSVLDMSQNNISGTIPKCIGNMTGLRVLDLSNNNISGSLPSNFSSTFIKLVKLSKNRLQGSLDNAFYYCSRLFILDLSHNNFSGSVPSSVGRLSQLSYLVLGHNHLQGQIPIELCKMQQLRFLDLSHSNISGHMPSCLNFTSYWTQVRYIFEQQLELTVKGGTYTYESEIYMYLSGIDISCNKLTGQIPPGIGYLRNTQVLNFSHNSLIGRIPPTFSNLEQIESLDLSYNNLQGTIPPTFSNLKQIESLDLSYNNLQGTIPHQLTNLTTIAVFNVSYNNLSGPTPNMVAQFATFDENSYKGNPFLCGWPLPKSCNDVDTHQSSPYDEESSDSLIDMEAFYWSFGIAYGMVLISIVAVLCINPHWRRVWFYYIQIIIDNSYYFLIDNVPFLSSFFPKVLSRHL